MALRSRQAGTAMLAVRDSGLRFFTRCEQDNDFEFLFELKKTVFAWGEITNDKCIETSGMKKHLLSKKYLATQWPVINCEKKLRISISTVSFYCQIFTIMEWDVEFYGSVCSFPIAKINPLNCLIYKAVE
jgi:hypothetical protein